MGKVADKIEVPIAIKVEIAASPAPEKVKAPRKKPARVTVEAPKAKAVARAPKEIKPKASKPVEAKAPSASSPTKPERVGSEKVPDRTTVEPGRYDMLLS